jgi:hypothetical protein
LTGLVGPPSSGAPTPAPAQGGFGPPAGAIPGLPAFLGGNRSIRSAAPPQQASLAGPIARALGAMGYRDLLNYALNATDRTYFTPRSAGQIQRAAVAGMAYLPREKEPLTALQELLPQAATASLRRAIARALETRLELSEAET